MSLNRTEQTLFDYWERAVDERRHWQMRVAELTRRPGVSPDEVARTLERELWEHLVERTPHVPALRNLNPGGLSRMSMLNLAEYLLRLWGPPPKAKPRSGPHG